MVRMTNLFISKGPSLLGWIDLKNSTYYLEDAKTIDYDNAISVTNHDQLSFQWDFKVLYVLV